VEEDITGLELVIIKVASTSGDLKDTKINPSANFYSPIWLLGITKQLSFNPCIWRWVSDAKETEFFNYTSKIGYQSCMSGKKQESRLQEKLMDLNLNEQEIQASISIIWDNTKPAKLQYFAWQVASGGLFTSSRAAHMDHQGSCVCYLSGLLETVEHYFLMCKYARRTWHWAWNIRVAFGLCPDISWRELASGIKPNPHTMPGQPLRLKALMAAWDVFHAALMWCIWCARCRTVFDHEPFNMAQVCQLAWKDTIFARMAYIKKSKHDFTRHRVEKQTNIAADFTST
jgi:hypothetical protein